MFFNDTLKNQNILQREQNRRPKVFLSLCYRDRLRMINSGFNFSKVAEAAKLAAEMAKLMEEVRSANDAVGEQRRRQSELHAARISAGNVATQLAAEATWMSQYAELAARTATGGEVLALAPQQTSGATGDRVT